MYISSMIFAPITFLYDLGLWQVLLGKRILEVHGVLFLQLLPLLEEVSQLRLKLIQFSIFQKQISRVSSSIQYASIDMSRDYI